MKSRSAIHLAFVIIASSCGIAHSEDYGWDQRITELFSGRYKEIHSELSGLPPKLKDLPAIPIDDQGGSGGFASIHGETTGPCVVEVRWPNSGFVDMVALVPARRYDANGLEVHYGMPGSFRIELLDVNGQVLQEIANEKNARSHPVRHGHPFVYDVSPPVDAAGLRITASELPEDEENDNNRIHAWAEVFILSGSFNLGENASVKSLGGASPPAPWQWKPEFLVDGQTPLGYPEKPASEHRNVGWLSDGRKNPNEPASLSVDLKDAFLVDAVRLLPVRRPTSDLPNGFGFPRKLTILTSDAAVPDGEEDWRIVARKSLSNPGHNPVSIRFESTRARHVRILADELWKAIESYPAYFALSEVEVLSGSENLALNKPVRSSDGMLNLIGSGGSYWSSSALSDGFGSDGKLVSIREWMGLFDQRLRLETRAHELRTESRMLVAAWRNATLAFFLIMSLVAVFAIIALPIRFRINSRRELIRVRERIAGDLHDEVGSNLGSIQMYADLAEGRAGPSEELKRIQRIASETVSAVRDIVWLLRPEGDHRIGVVEHLRETSSIMLETLNWKFHANEAAWKVELPDETTRHLFLFFREALHNILRHSKATEAEVTIEMHENHFKLAIADNGIGISEERLKRPSTLRALRQRSEALSGTFNVDSGKDRGTKIMLNVPLAKSHKSKRPTGKNSDKLDELDRDAF